MFQRLRASSTWKGISDLSVVYTLFTVSAAAIAYVASKAANAAGKPLYLVLLVGAIVFAVVLLGLHLVVRLLHRLRAGPVHSQIESGTDEQRRILEQAPHIDLAYDLPKVDAARTLIRDEQIRVINTSDSVAYNIQIGRKEGRRYTATFAVVPRAAKNGGIPVDVDIRERPGGSYFSGFERVLQLEYEDSSGADNFEVEVPLRVTFEDRKGNRFETRHKVVYDTFSGEAHTFLVSGTQPLDSHRRA